MVDLAQVAYGPTEGVQKACGGIITTSAKGLKGQGIPVTIKASVTSSLVKEGFWYTTSSGRIALFLTADQVERGHHSGDCESSVESLLPELQSQLDKLDKTVVLSEMKEIYCESESLDMDNCLTYLVFEACASLQDGMHTKYTGSAKVAIH